MILCVLWGHTLLFHTQVVCGQSAMDDLTLWLIIKSAMKKRIRPLLPDYLESKMTS